MDIQDEAFPSAQEALNVFGEIVARANKFGQDIKDLAAQYNVPGTWVGSGEQHDHIPWFEILDGAAGWGVYLREVNTMTFEVRHIGVKALRIQDKIELLRNTQEILRRYRQDIKVAFDRAKEVLDKKP